jgi:NADPH-dependent 2,4-dienoyl-CoA reductase/sulfur reductase-like enzyme
VHHNATPAIDALCVYIKRSPQLLKYLAPVRVGKDASAMLQPPCECEVVIVGAGVAGASAAYHLTKAGVRDIVVLDAGPVPGEGREEQKSGSSVMESAGTIKMMVQVFASSCN